MVAEGKSYKCETCGLVVTVDELCGCGTACDLICCGVPLTETTPKVKKTKAKVKAKKAVKK